ncbi:DUF6953 family protein [Paenibacillus sp. NRS-1782]|uniref:DUF6953 family protein n=1 Tax=unclassified Paenibacillus TaxID=185978 RepID=UPI003D2E8DEC
MDKTDSTPTTEQQIAAWMVAQIREVGTLKQEDAIAYVRSEYGEQYVFISEHGHVSLEKEIKKAFRKLHSGKIAWDRDGFLWAWT